jgi:hypothetical protein
MGGTAAAQTPFFGDTEVTLAQNATTNSSRPRGVTVVSALNDYDTAQNMDMDMSGSGHVHQHTHDDSMWMIEYHYMRMNQDGLLAGTQSIKPQTVLDQAAMTGKWTYADGTPLDMVAENMTMDMHMFMLMYAPTSKVTLMGMLNYLDNNMDMLMRMDMDMGGGMPMATMPMYSTMSMSSSGLGDTQLQLSYKLDDYLLFNPLLTLGVSLPTGSIDEKNSNGAYLPYNMQLGSGSYDILASYGMSNRWQRWHFGGDASYLWHTAHNSHSYSLGDKWTAQGFLKYHFPSNTTIETAVKYNGWSKIDGRDERIRENPNYYGGTRTDFWLAINQDLPRGFALQGRFGIPMYQKLNGVQSETDWIAEFAASWMF